MRSKDPTLILGLAFALLGSHIVWDGFYRPAYHADIGSLGFLFVFGGSIIVVCGALLLAV